MSIHMLKIHPGSKTERQFIRILNGVDVKLDSVLCRKASVFDTECDEYIMSDGLYQQIREKLSNIKNKEA